VQIPLYSRLMATAARFALPSALIAWLLVLLVGGGFIGTTFRPTDSEEQLQAAAMAFAALLAFMSAASALHQALHGARNWTLVPAFALSASLLGFWFLLAAHSLWSRYV
jgi:hypothetical protein